MLKKIGIGSIIAMVFVMFTFRIYSEWYEIAAIWIVACFGVIDFGWIIEERNARKTTTKMDPEYRFERRQRNSRIRVHDVARGRQRA